MERDLFVHMKAWHVSKVYFWDEYHTMNGTYRWDVNGTYRWDLCFGPVMPEGVACREHDFTNLVEMSNLEFERFVRSLPLPRTWMSCASGAARCAGIPVNRKSTGTTCRSTLI